MVQKFAAELPRVLAYLRWPAAWRHRLRTTNLAEGFFRHLRRYLGRFPGCINSAHSEQILGCFLLASEAYSRRGYVTKYVTILRASLENTRSRDALVPRDAPRNRAHSARQGPRYSWASC